MKALRHRTPSLRLPNSSMKATRHPPYLSRSAKCVPGASPSPTDHYIDGLAVQVRLGSVIVEILAYAKDAGWATLVFAIARSFLKHAPATIKAFMDSPVRFN